MDGYGGVNPHVRTRRCSVEEQKRTYTPAVLIIMGLFAVIALATLVQEMWGVAAGFGFSALILSLYGWMIGGSNE